jgi:anaerobic nitric oxide reductase transcription regulator
VLLLAGRFLELNRARLGLRSLRLSVAAQDALRRYTGRATCASWSM